MTCTRCGSSDVHRSRRKGACDQIQSLIGRYPYRCGACGSRFHAAGRYARTQSTAQSKQAPAPEQRYQSSKQTAEADNGPEMAFRAHPEKPQAKIVVQAETHEQLNQILLTLDKAINSYGKAARPENSRAYAGR